MRWAPRTPDPSKRRSPASAFDHATRSAGARPLPALPPIACPAINAACEALAVSSKRHCAAIVADPYADLRRWSAEARQSRNPIVEA
jgi:hypothetical protein